VVPRTASTAEEWMIDSFKNNTAKVIKSIATSISKLTISFDGWKANNDVLDLLGVVMHYLRDDHTLYNVVFAMRDILGVTTAVTLLITYSKYSRIITSVATRLRTLRRIMPPTTTRPLSCSQSVLRRI
jgi:hypothetical protein